MTLPQFLDCFPGRGAFSGQYPHQHPLISIKIDFKRPPVDRPQQHERPWITSAQQNLVYS